jgi:hypothetical protein
MAKSIGGGWRNVGNPVTCVGALTLGPVPSAGPAPKIEDETLQLHLGWKTHINTRLFAEISGIE